MEALVSMKSKTSATGLHELLNNDKSVRAKKDVHNPEGKPLEICDTLQPRGWGYIKTDDGKHKSPDRVMETLANARRLNANLLLNALHTLLYG